MKKILLSLATLFALALSASAEESSSFFEYTFDSSAAGPYPYVYVNDFKAYANSEYNSYFDDTYGLITVQTNATAHPPYGLQVLDLGSAEGKVLCLNCKDSGLGGILGFNVPETESNNPYYYINFHFEKSGNVNLSGKKVRIEVQYAIMHGTSATADDDGVISQLYIRNLSGSPVGGTNGVGVLANYDQQNSVNAGKLENWTKYTNDVEFPTDQANGPYRFCFEIKNGGKMNKRAFLFKSIKLTEIDAISDNYTAGKTESIAFGAINAKASTAWNPTLNTTDNTIKYLPSSYIYSERTSSTTDGTTTNTTHYNNCGEVLEYAVTQIETSKATDYGAISTAVSAITEFSKASDNSNLFTDNGDGSYKLEKSGLSADSGKYPVLALRVKAGANDVVVSSVSSYVINTTSNIVTNVQDLIANGEGVATYYNLSGVRVANPTAPGLYIRLQGGKASKVIIK